MSSLTRRTADPNGQTKCRPTTWSGTSHPPRFCRFPGSFSLSTRRLRFRTSCVVVGGVQSQRDAAIDPGMNDYSLELRHPNPLASAASPMQRTSKGLRKTVDNATFALWEFFDRGPGADPSTACGLFCRDGWIAIIPSSAFAAPSKSSALGPGLAHLYDVAEFLIPPSDLPAFVPA